MISQFTEWTYRFWYFGAIYLSPRIPFPMARSINLICGDPVFIYLILFFSDNLRILCTPFLPELLGEFGEQDEFFSSRLLLYEKGKYCTSFPNHPLYSFDQLFVQKGHAPNGSDVIGEFRQKRQPSSTWRHVAASSQSHVGMWESNPPWSNI